MESTYEEWRAGVAHTATKVVGAGGVKRDGVVATRRVGASSVVKCHCQRDALRLLLRAVVDDECLAECRDCWLVIHVVVAHEHTSSAVAGTNPGIPPRLSAFTRSFLASFNYNRVLTHVPLADLTAGRKHRRNGAREKTTFIR